MTHKNIPELWIQSAIDIVKAIPESKVDSEGAVLLMATATANAEIATAMAMVRIAEALETLAETRKT